MLFLHQQQPSNEHLRIRDTVERCLHLRSCACTRRNCPMTDARAHLRSSYCPVPSFLLQHLSFASAPRLCASPLCRSYCLPARLSFLFKPLRLAFVLRLRAWPLRAQKLLPPYHFVHSHSLTLLLSLSLSLAHRIPSNSSYYHKQSYPLPTMMSRVL
jgi:hypothetical protein